MPADKLLDIYRALEAADIPVWIDGGWGVDALLGEQTRAHGDVDLVVQEKDLNALTTILKDRGYRQVPRSDTRAWNFVLGNQEGSEVDIHVITFNEQGDGIYGPLKNDQTYPAYAFSGTGIIDGHQVRCMSVKYQITNHSGYELANKDYQDVKNLCAKFNLPLPLEFI